MRIGISYPHPRIRISPAKGRDVVVVVVVEGKIERDNKNDESRVGGVRHPSGLRTISSGSLRLQRLFLSFPRVQHIRSIPALTISFVFIFLRVTVDPLVCRTPFFLKRPSG